MTKVLVVDNEERTLRAIRSAVLAGGGVARTVHAGTADEAREATERILADFQPDFCIVDAHFGALTDGLTVIGAIRRWSEDVPVVLFSGFLDEPDTRSSILRAYQRVRHVQILSKNPFPTWEAFCQASGLL